MDPVSVFNALFDTKCLKLGRYHLRSGLVGPYYINLRRLLLYTDLMEAIVTQVYERFLAPPALSVTITQLRRRRDNRSTSTASQIMASIDKELKRTVLDAAVAAASQTDARAKDQPVASSDSDSQVGEEDVQSSSNEDGGWEEVSDGDCEEHNIIVSGVPYGAVPLAAAVAFKAKLPFLFERKEQKLYGDPQPLIDGFDTDQPAAAAGAEAAGKTGAGEAPKQQQVVLIEDVISSGQSILETARRLEQQGLKVEFVICVVDREENGVKLLLEEAGIRVLSLYKISAVLRVLEATGRISSRQFIDLRRWIVKNQYQAIGVNPTHDDDADDGGNVDGHSSQAAAVESTLNDNKCVQVADN